MFGVMPSTGMMIDPSWSNPTFTSSSSQPTVMKQQQGGHHLMSRIFGNKTAPSTSSTASKDKDKELSEVKQSQDIPSKDNDQFLESFPPGITITPSPFCKPLNHKLEARNEPSPRFKATKARSIDTQTPSISASAIVRDREKTRRILNGSTITDSSSGQLLQQFEQGLAELRITSGLSQPLSSSPSPSISTDSTMERSTDLPYLGGPFEDGDITKQRSRQLEHISILGAIDADAVQLWRVYAESYSKGHFNLSAPPPSPPRNLAFDYFPAVLPEQEKERLAASNRYDFLWAGDGPSEWDHANTSTLMSTAMLKFGTPLGSLSFFDGKDELLIASLGYTSVRISRPTSIAAHALLSDDVLVVLDTKKDWRFSGNPHVLGQPRIRFFAAAPMLSDDNHIVGIFSVFSDQPRPSFTATERRELAELSSQVTADINQQARLRVGSEISSLRTTPLLERDDSIVIGRRSFRNKVLAPEDIDQSMLPNALQLNKAKSPPAQDTKVFQGQHLSSEATSEPEPTPPSSSEGSEDNSFPGKPRGFGKNRNQLTINSDLHYFADTGELVTPDSEEFRAPTPRPFSSSDLTSYFPHPPNTPVLDIESSQMTFEDFMTLTDEDCAEDDSLPPEDLEPPPVKMRKVKSKRKLLHQSSRLTSTSISTAMTTESERKANTMVDAAFACKEFCETLGYDLIYVAEIYPSRPYLTEDELLAPGGLAVNWIVAHGLQKPKAPLALALHLKALRAGTLQQLSLKDADPEKEDDYMAGSLLGLYSDDEPAYKCSSGLVMGAFTRPKFVGEMGIKMTNAEVTRLMDAGCDLKAMILTKPGFQTTFRRVVTEPAKQVSYPANEAMEVQVYGRHSLVERRRLFPSDFAYRSPDESKTTSFDRIPDRHPPRSADSARKQALDVTSELHPANQERHEGMNAYGYPTPRTSPDCLPGRPFVGAGSHDTAGAFGHRYPSSEYIPNEPDLTEREKLPFDQQQPELYPGYPPSIRDGAEEGYDDAGHLRWAPQQPQQAPQPVQAPTKIIESAVEKKKTPGFTWFGTKSSKPALSTPEKKAAKALKAAAKAEAKAEKAEKEKILIVDAGLALPFHSVNRFRPF